MLSIHSGVGAGGELWPSQGWVSFVAKAGRVSSRVEVSWVTCPFGAPHGPRPSHRAWARNGTTKPRVRRTRRAIQAPRRCWWSQEEMGAESRGVGMGGLGTYPKRGLRPPQARSASKRAMRRAVARFLMAKPSAGMKEPWAPLGSTVPSPAARGPREESSRPPTAAPSAFSMTLGGHIYSDSSPVLRHGSGKKDLLETNAPLPPPLPHP